MEMNPSRMMGCRMSGHPESEEVQLPRISDEQNVGLCLQGAQAGEQSAICVRKSDRQCWVSDPAPGIRNSLPGGTPGRLGTDLHVETPHAQALGQECDAGERGVVGPDDADDRPWTRHRG